MARGWKNKRPKDTTVTYDPPAYTGNNIIHLDFGGAYVSGQGWNSYAGGDFYATPSSMSPFEQYNTFDTINRAYSNFRTLVTLDESMFDLTPQAYRQKVVFTDYSDWYGSAGGVAYRNSFGTGTFCFVFSKLLSNYTPYVAFAGVHEAGHTLGLRHAVDGYYDSTGAWVLIASYTQGKNWMGAGYPYPYHVFEEWVYIASGAKQYQFNVINATLN